MKKTEIKTFRITVEYVGRGYIEPGSFPYIGTMTETKNIKAGTIEEAIEKVKAHYEANKEIKEITIIGVNEKTFEYFE